MADKDSKYFNCSEEHELEHVSDKYKEKAKVKAFIHAKCKDKTIHYWTHEKLAEFLKENGYELKVTKTQADLIAGLTEQFGSKAQAQSAFNTVIGCLFNTLKSGDSISIKGFGSFKISERSARKGRNPATGAEMEIPASTTVKFTPAKALKDDLNGTNDN